jgi:two-component system response regulator HydG
MVSKKSLRVHLVENDRPVKILLERELDGTPTVVAVHSGDKAADFFPQRDFDTIQLDFELPGVGRVETQRRHSGADGSELVLLPRGAAPDPGAGDDEAAASEGEGAAGEVPVPRGDEPGGYQFLTRPLSPSDLGEIAHGVEERREPAAGGRAQRRPPVTHNPILGESRPMRELLDMVRRVAAGVASVLIQGETGTGKTIIAREIHAASPRADQRFVAINCSAFQDQLLESELFGHEKGSFTGATASKPGLFETADRGTLFLDEVGDMTPAMQAKLLQVLDDGELRRVGGTKTRRIDARILAASNKDLQAEVKSGRFREDLLFRLNVINLRVPPLHERREDVPILVEHFLDRFHLQGQPRKRMSPEVMRLLQAYSWPGNVRELANTVEGLILLAPGDEIQPEDLPPTLRPATSLSFGAADEPLPLSEIERLHIIAALQFTEGKKAPAARLLGIDVKTLRNKIQSYGIEV